MWYSAEISAQLCVFIRETINLCNIDRKIDFWKMLKYSKYVKEHALERKQFLFAKQSRSKFQELDLHLWSWPLFSLTVLTFLDKHLIRASQRGIQM